MAIHPIDPLTILLTLQHIVPPSQIHDPLPPHVISKPLLQRHHFLSLHPAADPAAYLSWPSAYKDQSHPVYALESLNTPPPDLELAAYAVRYTADPESAYAHVRISPEDPPSAPGVRLVFLWDADEGTWKYHDVAFMPFPQPSFPSVQEAMSPVLADPHEQSVQIYEQSPDDDQDHDNYWDAYGGPDDDATDPVYTVTKDDSHLNSEDAYWAQYATVHGSGDSTRPSPRPEHKRHLPDHPPHDDEPITIPYASMHPDMPLRPDQYDPLNPPSPHGLSRRLAALSPREATPPLLDDTSDNMTPSPTVAGSDSLPGMLGGVKGCEIVMMNADGDARGVVVCNDTDAALKQGIRGLYQLWSSGSRSTQRDEDKARFLSLVREAVGDS